MSTTPDKLEPGYFEADDEGYIQADEEAGPDGKATGVTVALRVDDPSVQIKTMHGETFEFTEEELDAWPDWIEKQYPADDWNFDADDMGEAYFWSSYQEGETTEQLLMRLTVDNARYNKIRNRCCIYYTMMHEFITRCKEARDEVAS
jgi:hypothetical protein